MDDERLKKEIKTLIEILVPDEIYKITIYEFQKNVTPFSINIHGMGYFGILITSASGLSIFISPRVNEIHQIRVKKVTNNEARLIIDGIEHKIDIVNGEVTRLNKKHSDNKFKKYFQLKIAESFRLLKDSLLPQKANP